MYDIAKAGHELNAHGWVNDETASDDDEEAERDEIRRCTKAITDATGVRPVGWTGPGSAGSKNTLTILKAEGYLWNGDDASDDLPFLRDTDKGPIEIEFFATDAPKAVENFRLLAEHHYYDGLTFHRVVRGFMIQAGDPEGNGQGGESAWGGTFADEINPDSALYRGGYRRGLLAMANRGADTNV